MGRVRIAPELGNLNITGKSVEADPETETFRKQGLTESATSGVQFWGGQIPG